MPEIVLTDEQAKVVPMSGKPVLVKTPNGTVLGTLPPLLTEEEIAEAKRRLATETTWYTTEQVLAHLRSPGKK